MASVRVTCPHCGVQLGVAPEQIGKPCRCGKCKEVFTPSPSEAPAAPVSGPEPTVLPKFMKANRRIAGKLCPHCGRQIELGEDVFNCPTCQDSMHKDCETAAGGCANPDCPRTVSPRRQESTTGFQLQDPVPPPRPPAPMGARTSRMAPDERPCRFCGEPIKVNARKCRFCNEFQNEADRKKHKRSSGGGDDDTLNVWEIIFAILCGTFACILGIVYLIQGKRKGWKLILIAIIAQVILAVLGQVLKAVQ